MPGGRRPALSDQLPPPHGRLRDRLREETESAILDAAEQAIGEEGLNAARVERIAARAGVAVGTLYNHFRDRSALVNALYEARAGELHDLLAASLAATADRPAAEQVRVMLAAMVRHARDHGRLFSALMQDNDGPSRLRPPTSARSDMGTFAEASSPAASRTGSSARIRRRSSPRRWSPAHGSSSRGRSRGRRARPRWTPSPRSMSAASRAERPGLPAGHPPRHRRQRPLAERDVLP